MSKKPEPSLDRASVLLGMLWALDADVGFDRLVNVAQTADPFSQYQRRWVRDLVAADLRFLRGRRLVAFKEAFERPQVISLVATSAADGYQDLSARGITNGLRAARHAEALRSFQIPALEEWVVGRSGTVDAPEASARNRIAKALTHHDGGHYEESLDECRRAVEDFAVSLERRYHPIIRKWRVSDVFQAVLLARFPSEDRPRLFRKLKKDDFHKELRSFCASGLAAYETCTMYGAHSFLEMDIKKPSTKTLEAASFSAIGNLLLMSNVTQSRLPASAAQGAVKDRLP